MKETPWYSKLTGLLRQQVIRWPFGMVSTESPPTLADEVVPLADSELRTLERARLAASRQTKAFLAAHHTATPCCVGEKDRAQSEVATVNERGIPAGESDTVAANSDSGTRWLAIVEECVALIDEFEDGLDRYHAEAKPLAEHAIQRIVGILELCGVETIQDEATFDVARHQPIPIARVSQGTPLAKTLAPGLCIGSRILRRARVAIRL